MNKLAQSYGLSVGEGVGDATIELVMAFEPRLRESAAHRGRYYHLRRAIDLLWNEPRRVRGGKEYDPRKHDAYIWNEWSEQLMRMFCEHKVRTITGPNSSSKSTSAALYHLCAWLASPSNSLVIVTSTDRLGLKARFWREVTKYYRMLPPEYMFGNLVQSDIALQTRKGDYDAGLFGVATGQDNDVDKAVAKIVGRHNTYTYAVVDEMQATNEGLVKGAISLEAGSDNFEFTGLGNAQSELDPHGTMSEPKAGWDSISDDDEMWETKTGVCLHLDGLRCPRVLEGDQYYPGLLRREHIENTIRDFGEDSPEFWSTRRGFWAPQGVTKTVLTVADVEKFRAKDKAIFAGKYIWGAALDPAFEGGDRCVLRIGREGEFDDGVVGMELTETIVIKVRASDPLPIHYQITNAVREECEKRSIEPKMFALDTTGEGGGLASIMMQEWSRNILHVEFGGKPSNRPISPDDKKTADKEYQNRVSELWFWFRVLVRRGMIRGLDIDTLREFCQRRWSMKGMYKMVEPKAEMKLRTHRSPDCFIAGTLVSTPNGDIPIESISVGDVVLTPVGESRVLKVHKTQAEMLSTLEFTNGRVLCGKPNHRLFVKNVGWMKIDAISVASEMESVHDRWKWRILDSLFTRAGNSGFKQQADIIRTGGTGKIKGRDFFIESSGLSVMGLFQRVCASITRMVIGRIIESKIWRLCHDQNMRFIITIKPIQRLTQSVLLGWIRPELQLSTGTLLRRDWSGTASTVLRWQPIVNNARLSARSAAMDSHLKRCASSNFVATRAGKNSDDHSLKWTRLASFVAKTIGQINTTRRGFVVQHARTERVTETECFNLTLVEENAYYANGVLVENCADAAVVLAELFHERGHLNPGRIKSETSTDWSQLAKRYNNVQSGYLINA